MSMAALVVLVHFIESGINEHSCPTIITSMPGQTDILLQ
jgi:hypothetical protein